MRRTATSRMGLLDHSAIAPIGGLDNRLPVTLRPCGVKQPGQGSFQFLLEGIDMSSLVINHSCSREIATGVSRVNQASSVLTRYSPFSAPSPCFCCLNQATNQTNDKNGGMLTFQAQFSCPIRRLSTLIRFWLTTSQASRR